MNAAAADLTAVVVERDLPHPPDRVWRALTQSALLEEWLMQNDFQAIVGHRFTFRAPPMPHWNGITDCEVLEIEPLRRLVYRWNSSGDEASNGLRTVVTWTLTPTPHGVRLRMEQTGFRPGQEANVRGASFGWQKYVAALEQCLAAPAGDAAL